VKAADGISLIANLGGYMTAETGSANIISKLPKHCLSRDRLSGRTVILIRGKIGAAKTDTAEIPEVYNHRLGLTYEQIDAMEYGSTLGFDVPLADPDYVRRVRSEFGQPVGPIEVPAAGGKSAAKPATAPPPPSPIRDSVLSNTADINLLPEFKAA